MLKRRIFHPLFVLLLVRRQRAPGSSFGMSVRPRGRTWLPTGRFFIQPYIWAFFEYLSRKFKFHENLTRITGTLHKDLGAFMISRWILVRTRNISEKSCRENQNTRFTFSNFFLFFVVFFFRKSCRLWGDVEKYCRAEQVSDDNMAHAHHALNT